MDTRQRMQKGAENWKRFAMAYGMGVKGLKQFAMEAVKVRRRIRHERGLHLPRRLRASTKKPLGSAPQIIIDDPAAL